MVLTFACMHSRLLLRCMRHILTFTTDACGESLSDASIMAIARVRKLVRSGLRIVLIITLHIHLIIYTKHFICLNYTIFIASKFVNILQFVRGG